MSELCGTCRHKFSEHFVTFDGSKTGCTHYYPGGMESGSACACAGFAIIFRPRTPKEFAELRYNSMRNGSPDGWVGLDNPMEPK